MFQERIWAEISREAILHNINKIKGKANRSAIMAVLKANAYGYGAAEMAGLIEDEVDFFGVNFSEEAVNLRENGVRKNILLFFPDFSKEDIIHFDLTPSIESVEGLVKLIAVSKEHGRKIPFHLRLNTGMYPFGLQQEYFQEVINLIKENGEHIHLEGVYSQFAATVKDNAYFVGKQNLVFHDLVGIFERELGQIKYIHIAGSDATLNFTSSHYNMVRIGNLLFGTVNGQVVDGYKNAMSVKAKISDIRTIDKGETAYLGHNHQLELYKPVRYGIVTAGLSDGLTLSGEQVMPSIKKESGKIVKGLFKQKKSYITHGDKPLYLLGEPAAHHTFVDLSENETAGLGDVVELKIPSQFLRESVLKKYIDA